MEISKWFLWGFEDFLRLDRDLSGFGLGSKEYINFEFVIEEEGYFEFDVVFVYYVVEYGYF